MPKHVILRHRYLVPLASYLPEKALQILHRRLPIGMDPADGWTVWTEASYHRYCRKEGAT